MMRPGFVTDGTFGASSKDKQPMDTTVHLHENQELNTMEQAHVDVIMSLNTAFKTQQSRSLDHYFHRDLTDAELQIVNAEQVLSRFIHHQQARSNPCSVESKFSAGRTEGLNPRGILSTLRKVLKALAMWGMASNVPDDTSIEDGLEDSKNKTHLHRQYVVVVPQLWLWKMDSKLQHPAHI